MIKLTGSVSRKVPIPGTEYSSQSFSAEMEIEVGNDATLSEVKKKFKEMYLVLEDTVKEQIAANGAYLPEEADFNDFENNGQTEDAPITSNQRNLIEKLVREQEIFGKERIRLLGIKSKEQAKIEIKNLLAKGSQRR